ncbi:PrsW family intramembrane metalloprotease [Paenibacillus piri]|uniref:PrsW family intramembrane metalloprotease n=1 Tax=Paenibacillus piri TaxID=2547395 RepID=A0A4R5K658_9BACL|nr:PrsW family intramembrane metalloprotease [Paenibacillus piri]
MYVEFEEFIDGIVYAVAIAAGFATVENLFYVFLAGGSTFQSFGPGRCCGH